MLRVCCFAFEGSTALQFVESAGEPGGETVGDREESTGTETQTGPAGLSAHTLYINHTQQRDCALFLQGIINM